MRMRTAIFLGLTVCAGLSFTACSDEVTRPPTDAARQADLNPPTPGQPCPGCFFLPEKFQTDDPTRVLGPGGYTFNRWLPAGDPAADYLLIVQDDGDPETDVQVSYGGVVLRRGTLLGAPSETKLPIRITDQPTYLKVTLRGKPGASAIVSVIAGAKSIGPSGGSIRAPGGEVSLTVPAGALDQPVALQIIVIDSSGRLDSQKPGGPHSPIVRLLPDGLHFQTDIRMELSLSADKQSLRGYALYRLDPENGFWVREEGSGQDSVGNVIAWIDHFTDFDAARPPISGGGTVTYAITGRPSKLSSATTAEYDENVRRAFKAWEPSLKEFGVTLQPWTQSGQIGPDIEIGVLPSGYADANALAAAGSCSSQSSGGGSPCKLNSRRFIGLDDGRTWRPLERGISDKTGEFNPQRTLMHEIGHTIGLSHYPFSICPKSPASGPVPNECFSPPVMAAINRHPHTPVALSCNDLSGLGVIYGAPRSPLRCAVGIEIHGGDGQQARIGTAVAIPPSVRVVDQYGDGVEGITVVFKESGALKLGTAIGTVAVTGAAGVASVGGWIMSSTLPVTHTLEAIVDFMNAAGPASVIIKADATLNPPTILPDLIVSSVQLSSTSVLRNTFFALTYTINNAAGAGQSGISTFDVLPFLSVDAVLDASDIPLVSGYSVWSYHLPVSWFASHTVQFFAIPGSVSPGLYHIIVLADAKPGQPPNFYPGVTEANEGNNWRASVRIDVR